MRPKIVTSLLLFVLFAPNKMISQKNSEKDEVALVVKINIHTKGSEKKLAESIEGLWLLASPGDDKNDLLKESTDYQPFDKDFNAEFKFKSASKGSEILFRLDTKKILSYKKFNSNVASFYSKNDSIYIKYFLKKHPEQRIILNIKPEGEVDNQPHSSSNPVEPVTVEPPNLNSNLAPTNKLNDSILINIQKSLDSVKQRLIEFQKPFIANTTLEFNNPIYHSSIFFEKNSFALNEKSSKELFKIKNSLPSQYIIVVKTYTDKDGDRDLNLVLSTMRANKISDFFINNGVNPLNIRTFPFGEVNISNSKSTDSDRRGEITIYAPSN
jgi:outer membrane protein OmpA-like peptidoglycan-associated protein